MCSPRSACGSRAPNRSIRQASYFLFLFFLLVNSFFDPPNSPRSRLGRARICDSSPSHGRRRRRPAPRPRRPGAPRSRGPAGPAAPPARPPRAAGPCGGGAPTGRRQPAARRAARHDRHAARGPVGGYGDPRPTPVLDALAARGVRFATAVAHAPLTAPSHASILTGLTPLRHGVRDNGGFVAARRRSRRWPRRSAPPATAPPRSSPASRSDRRFGLGRGFEVYDDRLPHGNDPRRAPYVERPRRTTTRAALAGGAGRPGRRRPWFPWVHYFDPHAPYEPPAESLARVRRSPYDGEMAFVDRELGRLLRRLDGPAARRARSCWSRRTTARASASTARRPTASSSTTRRCACRGSWPDRASRPAGASPRVARLIDVAPTLLDLAGLAGPGRRGRSLAAASRATDGRRAGLRRVAVRRG